MELPLPFRRYLIGPVMLTFLNEVPSLTSGTLGKNLLGLISSDPAFSVYKSLITNSRSEVVFTGKNRFRGTFIPTRK